MRGLEGEHIIYLDNDGRIQLEIHILLQKFVYLVFRFILTGGLRSASK